MSTREEVMDGMHAQLAEHAERGLSLRTTDDAVLDGRTIGLDRVQTINFASCSYLGLEVDSRLKDATCAAAQRYGSQFSCSRAFLQVSPYVELEALLEELFDAPALVCPTTTLGHIATLPVLIGSRDAVIVDQQVHHSVQTAVDVVRPNGAAVTKVPHSDIDALERTIERLARRHRSVWYLIDGVYSIFADFAPYAELATLLERHEQLHIYADDSHGVGWYGRHGRGPTFEALGRHDRVVVAASLNKSFAAAGGAVLFPSEAMRDRVRLVGGPMIFSGPVQPPMLGAALASARIHLSAELPLRQRSLIERIDLATERIVELGLPLASPDRTPIRYLNLGELSQAEATVERLIADGFYVNIVSFPGVPIDKPGVRFTLTLHHERDDIERLCEALARCAETRSRSNGARR